MYVISTLHAQKNIRIIVSDTQGNLLPYPEFIIGSDFHRIGMKNGEIEVSSEQISQTNSIIVKYIGYKTSHIRLDSLQLTKNPIHVTLQERAYELPAAIATPSDFSADKYFQQRKKRWLLPYFHRYLCDIGFTMNSPSGYTYNGKIVAESHREHTEIDTTRIWTDKKISNKKELHDVLERASEISYSVANIFCHKIDRNKFYCTYMGEKDGLEYWDFSIRKQKNLPWGLQEDDALICIVSLDKYGIIKNINTQLSSSSNHSTSYLLDTEYSLKERKIIPTLVKIRLLPNSQNKETKALSLVATYSEFR